MTSHWLDRLNPAQREAATYGNGPLLVVAGAGTGKTMTLACRVAYLLEQGVPPERVLLLTFTRRAAAEMIRRAAELTAEGLTRRIWGGTFHAVANRLLRIYGRALGLASDFTILDASDAADLMSLIRNEQGMARGNRRFPRKETLVAIYSRTIAAREKLADVLETRFPWCQQYGDEIGAIFEQYTHRKRAQQVLDYDDLLLYWGLLCAAPDVGPALVSRFEHVLVDEYQDTNALQCDILRALRRSVDNIAVVGDDAQAIYSFRAATVRNILDFPEHFPGTTVVKLEQNYRSTQPIIAASNAVMSDAKERYTKELWSTRASDVRPQLVHCRDEPAQSRLVCDNILARLEQGTPLLRQAVLFRAGHHSDQLEVELARRNVPFHKYGGLKFIETAHIKDLLAILRILENPFDEISWFRVLLLLDGVGPRTARKIVDALGDDRSTQINPLSRLLQNPPTVPAAARRGVDSLRSALADCQGAGSEEGDEKEPAQGSGPSISVQVERARRFYEPLFEERYDNAAIRIRDLEQLEQIAKGYRSRRSFLTDLTLDPPTATADLAQAPFLEEDYLVLSTIHSAKGCEWEVVHILHAADGMIPSDMALGQSSGLEEERRLFYVAMTRARDALFVYFPLRYYHRGRGLSDANTFAQLTRFMPTHVRSLFAEWAEPVPDASAMPGGGPADVAGLHAWMKDLWRTGSEETH